MIIKPMLSYKVITFFCLAFLLAGYQSSFAMKPQKKRRLNHNPYTDGHRSCPISRPPGFINPFLKNNKVTLKNAHSAIPLDCWNQILMFYVGPEEAPYIRPSSRYPNTTNHALKKLQVPFSKLIANFQKSTKRFYVNFKNNCSFSALRKLSNCCKKNLYKYIPWGALVWVFTRIDESEDNINILMQDIFKIFVNNTKFSYILLGKGSTEKLPEKSSLPSRNIICEWTEHKWSLKYLLLPDNSTYITATDSAIDHLIEILEIIKRRKPHFKDQIYNLKTKISTIRAGKNGIHKLNINKKELSLLYKAYYLLEKYSYLCYFIHIFEAKLLLKQIGKQSGWLKLNDNPEKHLYMQYKKYNFLPVISKSLYSYEKSLHTQNFMSLPSAWPFKETGNHTLKIFVAAKCGDEQTIKNYLLNYQDLSLSDAYSYQNLSLSDAYSEDFSMLKEEIVKIITLIAGIHKHMNLVKITKQFLAQNSVLNEKHTNETNVFLFKICGDNLDAIDFLIKEGIIPKDHLYIARIAKGDIRDCAKREREYNNGM